MDRNALAIAHEDALALFIEPAWRPRFRESLADPRLRKKMRARLYHFRHLDHRYASEVASKDQNSIFLLRERRRRGAPEECHVLSADSDVDGRVMGLKEALELVVDHGAWTPAFISCLPGKLAYFHEEEVANRYVLQR
jgi:hypothetical protein